MQAADGTMVTGQEVDLAHRISAFARTLGLATDAIGAASGAPRPQRNRMHIDVSVPHDEARRRIEAALAAGGTLTYDAEAPAFWVLADAEGDEACVCTWPGRDP